MLPSASPLASPWSASVMSTRIPSNTAFPVHLHHVLTELERDDLSHIASWQPHGRCFKVHDRKEFVSRILPLWFRQSMYSSFQRQLNLYGFTRICSGTDNGCYYHDLFLRGQPNQAKGIKRTTARDSHRDGHFRMHTPNFYALPHLEPTRESSNVESVPVPEPTAPSIAPVAHRGLERMDSLAQLQRQFHATTFALGPSFPSNRETTQHAPSVWDAPASSWSTNRPYSVLIRSNNAGVAPMPREPAMLHSAPFPSWETPAAAVPPIPSAPRHNESLTAANHFIPRQETLTVSQLLDLTLLQQCRQQEQAARNAQERQRRRDLLLLPGRLQSQQYTRQSAPIFYPSQTEARPQSQQLQQYTSIRDPSQTAARLLQELLDRAQVGATQSTHALSTAPHPIQPQGPLTTTSIADPFRVVVERAQRLQTTDVTRLFESSVGGSGAPTSQPNPPIPNGMSLSDFLQLLDYATRQNP